MARDFGGGNDSDDVEVADTAALRNLGSFTVCGWAFRTGDPGQRFCEKGSVASREWTLVPRTALGTTFLAFRWNTTDGSWKWNADITVNTWVHVALTYSFSSTTNDPILYYDGVDQGAADTETTPAGSATNAGVNNMIIGNRADDDAAFAGRIAEFAYWNVILTANEVRTLASGISPSRVRPSSLFLYLPLHGIDSPEPNYGQEGGNGTVTLTTQANHAPIAPPFGFDTITDGAMSPATLISDAIGVGIIPFMR